MRSLARTHFNHHGGNCTSLTKQMEFVIANGDEAPRGWVTLGIPPFADQFIEEPGEQHENYKGEREANIPLPTRHSEVKIIHR
jgi:hypothetical protein